MHRKVKRAADSTHTSGRFPRYSLQAEEPIRHISSAESAEARALLEAWETYSSAGFTYEEDREYATAQMLASSIRTPSELIERFSLFLADYSLVPFFIMKAGFFLSALVNESGDDLHMLRTSNLPKGLDYMGYRNRKEIIVDGDVGDFAGAEMLRGEMMIHGNAGMSLGERIGGGDIIVTGDTANLSGCMMKGGSLIIQGNAGSLTGEYMEGGEIHIGGECSGTGTMRRGGRIIQLGKELKIEK